MITLIPIRTLGEIEVDCTLEEVHTDSLFITRHPLEKGARASDHAFKEPMEVLIRAAWSNSTRKAGGDESYVLRIYEKLLALQKSCEPFDIQTGKRKYANMLIATLSTTTDNQTAAVLSVNAMCQEVIIVETTLTSLPPKENQAAPEETAATVERGQVAPKAATLAPDTVDV